MRLTCGTCGACGAVLGNVVDWRGVLSSSDEPSVGTKEGFLDASVAGNDSADTDAIELTVVLFGLSPRSASSRSFWFCDCDVLSATGVFG